MAYSFSQNWSTYRLADCTEVIIDYRGKTPKKTNYGIPLITAKVVKGGRIETPNEFIAIEDYDIWMRRGIPRAGDVIVTTEAPLGEVAQLDERKVALAQRIITLRGKEGVLDNTFLKYALQSSFVQNNIQARATGTTVLGIKQSELRKVILPIPPLPEQKAIAHILGALDDKIELNRKMNETLEAMARTIFKSWFVDFEPIPGLGPHKEWQDSPIGRIPKGWSVVPLPEGIEVNPSRALRKGAIAPYLDMANMPTHSARAMEVYDREFGSGMRFIDGDTLVARITPCLENGKTCFVDFLGSGKVGWGSTEYIVLRPKPPMPPEFAYFLSRTEDFRSFAISNMTGSSGRQRVPADSFNHFLIVLPPAEIAGRFGQFAHATIDKMKANDEQSRTLATIRDALLPKLISGELKASAAVKYAKDVV